METVEFNQHRDSWFDIDNLSFIVKDYCKGIAAWRLWLGMSISEIRRRYKRTIIGPFWTTLSLAIFITCMGLLLSGVWRQDMQNFMPFFCTGFIVWQLIAAICTESCTTFVTQEALMKQVQFPYSVYAFFVVTRNTIVLCHHFVIYIAVAIYFHIPINANQLMILPAVAMLFITGTVIATLLGIVCARYRDIQQLVNSCLQLCMFVTPIFWKPGHMGRRGVLLADLNPLYHYVSILRMPLLGEPASLRNWLVVITITSTLGFLAWLLFARTYRKLIFWI